MKIEAFVKGNRKVTCTKLEHRPLVLTSDSFGPCQERFVTLGNDYN